MSSYGSLPSPLSSHFPLTPRHSSPFSPVHSSTKSQGMLPSFFGGRSRSSSSSSVRSISEKDRLEVMHNIYTKLLDPHHLDTIRQFLIGVHSTGRRSNVLDVGTGTGQWSLNLGNSQPFSDIISIDHSWSNFGTGRSFNGNVEYDTVDFLKPLPWLPNSFDLIHVRGLLLDIPNYHLLIERLALLLRPGGMLVIIETEPRYLSASGGPVSDNLQVWYECIRSAFAARQVDVELPSRLPVILAASGVFRNPAITVEAGMPSAGYVTGDSRTLSAVGRMHKDVIAANLRRMVPTILAHGYSEGEVSRLFETCLQELARTRGHPLKWCPAFTLMVTMALKANRSGSTLSEWNDRIMEHIA